MVKKVSLSIFILTIAVITFFFWGSSNTLKPGSNNWIAENESLTSSYNDTFSLVTYNLGYLSGMTNNKPVERSPKLFHSNMENVIQLFNQIKPNFIAFQEIDFDADRSFNVNQFEEILTQNNFKFGAASVNWDKQYVPFPYWPVSNQFGKVVSGQGILSDYEVAQNEVITLIKPEQNPFYYNAFYLDRLVQVSKIKLPKNELVIMNLHLEAFHWETRDEQIKTVLKEFHKYSEDYPVLLCGDFNSTPPGASFQYQKDHVIQTLLNDYQIEMAINLEENKTHEKDYYTFNSDYPDRRIDYIFYNPKFIEVLDARVLTEAGQISDHLPVWMLFKFRR